MLLDVNTANITHVGFNCKLILTNIVQVDIISLQLVTDVMMIKDLLKNRIRDHLTASEILATVIQISDNDNHDNSKHPMFNAILTLQDSGHYSITESLHSGITDRELEENEHNARILEQRRMKSKLRILHDSQFDNSILNPIRLQLTGNNVQLYASKNY
ncbi:unnamed protein product [Wuchereria bancrofti]|uniref:Uncharacterized protein n=1 Tax=Wuchereria bancrofti TaxID=6293 RepID=A0A3P7EBB0_WUCBA|nr:unnamed protein product [Wuchereria bancrofti]